MDKKLGIIVPYRNRFDDLQKFKKGIKKYLKRKNIPYKIFIIQQDDAKLFNRGILLNIGFTYAKKEKCDYVVFHDLDMIPFRVDYSYSETPIHLATRFKDTIRTTFEEYFGGVTMFPIEDFEKINGYSNKYWGWGYEDTDLLYRCVKNNLVLDNLKIKNQIPTNTNKLRFNGVNSYVRGKNAIDFKTPKTIYISFKPDDLTCDVNQYADDFNVLTIPGYDFSISFNSYSRYSFCTFNKNHEALYVNSKIIKNYYTNLIITIDELNQQIKVYQDGELINEITDFGELYDYSNQEFFYLGMGNPLSATSFKYFKGLIDSFIVIDDALEFESVSILSKDKYKIIDKLKKVVWYESDQIKKYKLIDLSNNKNDGEIFNCETTDEKIDLHKEVKIPFRRDCIFTCLPHEENGFVNNAWKDQSIRWNQLRFYNEVCMNDELVFNEGLSTLNFVEHEILNNEDNVKHITVGV